MESIRKITSVIFGLLLMGAISEACVQKFKQANKIADLSTVCFTKSGLPQETPLEELSKGDFDDKCSSKCILKGLEVVTGEDKLDREGLSDFIEDNSPPEAVVKMTEIATTCADNAEAEKGDDDPDNCKLLKKFYTCFVTNAEKLC